MMDIAEIVGGGTPATSEEDNFGENGIAWLTPADLTGYKKTYVSRGRRDLTPTGYQACGARLMPKGTVLFSSRAPIGYCVITSNEICTNQGFKSFILNGSCTPEYVRHYLLGSVDYAESKASGTTFKELSGARAGNLAIPIAPLAEQRRIVAKIDALTAKSKRAREHLDHIPRLVEKYKQAILAAAFRGDLTQDCQNRRSENGLPLKWRWVEALQLFDDGPTNGYSPKAATDGPGTKSLKLSATTTGSFILNEKTTKRLLEDVPSTAKFWLKPGDILIQRANSLEYVGATAIFDGPPNQYIYPDLMIRVRIASPSMRLYFWRYMNCISARSWLRERATGTAGNMPKISGAILKALPVPLPPVNEQAEIVRRIEAAFAWIERVAGEATSARKLVDTLDKAILKKAFRGELVPQDPNDEPASRLLARIKAERQSQPRRRKGR